MKKGTSATEPENLDDPLNQFRIGAVSRITQIPVDTLRAWERRYNVVEPDRTSSSARLYSQADISRLKLLKQLVDAGHAISSIAGCSSSELEQRLELHLVNAPAQRSVSNEVESLIVFKDSDAHTLDLGAVMSSNIDLIGEYSDWYEFVDEISLARPSAAILQLATITDEDALKVEKLVNHLSTTQVLVTYGFAAHQNIDRLERNGIILLRGTASSEQLARLLRGPVASVNITRDETTERPRRLFDDATLEELARISSTVQCECPHHLVDIVKTLNQFERYSAECESRSKEDAALHAQLTVTTAASRHMFEQALLEVAEYEGIELPDNIRSALAQ